MPELSPYDKQTLEVIRSRADTRWLSSASMREHYREDVRFLIERIDELTAGVVAAPVEDAKGD